jgi:hypothetical protein
VVESVKDLKTEDIQSELGALQVSLQSQIAGITAAMSNKVETMHGLDTAIGEKQSSLSELFDVEKEFLTLEETRAHAQEETEQFERMKQNRLAEWKEDEEERAKKWQREDEERAYNYSQQVAREQTRFDATRVHPTARVGATVG